MRAGLLHEGSADIVDGLDAAQVDGSVEIRKETLPAAIGVGPGAHHAVGERRFAGSRIFLMPGNGVLHGFSDRQVLGRDQRFLALAELFPQVEGMVALGSQIVGVMLRTLAEIRPVLVFRQRPSILGDGQGTGPKHIFGMVRFGDVFVPEVALHAEHVTVRIFRNALDGIVGIHLLQRQVAADGFGFLELGVLVVVEVAPGLGRHHHVVAHRGGLDAAFGTAPRHHGGVGGQAAFQDFVPAQQGAAVFVEEALDAGDQITLQLFRRVQPFLLHPLLAEPAVGPVALRGLIAADMDVLRRENIHDFEQDRFQELEGIFIAGAKVAAGPRSRFA